MSIVSEDTKKQNKIQTEYSLCQNYCYSYTTFLERLQPAFAR